VQRREHEVPRLGGEERRFDGLVIAHLADQDDVRILPQRAPQRVRERLRVDVHLPLVHNRMVIPVQVLDRVLHRHDVRRARGVDVVDHRGERRALAAAGRARHEHETALFRRDLLEDRRQPELVDRLDPRRDDAQDEAHGATLLKHVAAEAPHPRNAVGEVHFLLAAELLALIGAEELVRHLFGVALVEPFFL
jgi:hypothetical protein